MVNVVLNEGNLCAIESMRNGDEIGIPSAKKTGTSSSGK
jgi:hypothetical protein